MKLKNILLLLVVLFTSFSCQKEDVLYPTDPQGVASHKFPEGTPIDDKAIAIYDKFGMQMLWTDVSNKDINRTWVASTGNVRCSTLSQEQADSTMDFLIEHIFANYDSVLFKPMTRRYVYLVYNYASFLSSMWAPKTEELIKGMDSWVFCFYGGGPAEYPLYTPHTFPETPEAIRLYKLKIFGSIIANLVNSGLIKVPEEYSSSDFDFVVENKTKPMKYNDADSKNVNYFMNRGFCGLYNKSSYKIANLSKAINPTENFISYACFVMQFTPEEIMAGATMSTLNKIEFKNYPTLMKYYNFTYDYFKNKLGYDLKKINSFIKE